MSGFCCKGSRGVLGDYKGIATGLLDRAWGVTLGFTGFRV